MSPDMQCEGFAHVLCLLCERCFRAVWMDMYRPPQMSITPACSVEEKN